MASHCCACTIIDSSAAAACCVCCCRFGSHSLLLCRWCVVVSYERVVTGMFVDTTSARADSSILERSYEFFGHVGTQPRHRDTAMHWYAVVREVGIYTRIHIYVRDGRVSECG